MHVIISAVVLLLLAGCGRSDYIMDSDSMTPTFRRGDRVVVEQLGAGTVKRGDIVAFNSSVYPGAVFMMRVLAQSGDIVRFEPGGIYVNGEAFQVHGVAYKYKERREYVYGYGGDYLVPAGAVFVTGDNLEEAADSRVFGPVDLKQIIGKVSGKR